MKRGSRRTIGVALPLGLAIAALITPSRRVEAQSGSQAATAGADSGRPRVVEADARFMQEMIGHHAQALAMAALVPDRTTSETIRLLAHRIEVSQRDEIAQMRRWLEDHHRPVPDPDAAAAHHGHEGHHAAGGPGGLMPGMLTPEEMARLAAAAGPEFERLFLQHMIRHHEGALTMVARLFATPGAGQEPQLFGLASDVDADQRAEIARMRALLSASTRSATPGAARRP